MKGAMHVEYPYSTHARHKNHKVGLQILICPEIRQTEIALLICMGEKYGGSSTQLGILRAWEKSTHTFP
ncbi:MAG: hypothetical protein RBT80_01400 [Candidatus Vecturithrix sp.]|jgi:hypothetical protein|nr:hypothetical protein [Candidatus Vecturithrix sp.]